LIATSRFDEAIKEINRALNIDPLSLIINTISGWPLYFSRRYDEAMHHYRKALEIEPNFFPAHFLLGNAYEQKGEMDSALDWHQKARQLDQTAMTLAGLGRAYGRSGSREKAMEVLDEMVGLSESQYVSPYDIAEVYLCMGENDRAIEWLERACEDRSSWLILLGVEPRFDPLRSDPRFKDILARIGFAADGSGHPRPKTNRSDRTRT
jgi:tetratricopeptide (TPR) repeat protein